MYHGRNSNYFIIQDGQYPSLVQDRAVVYERMEKPFREFCLDTKRSLGQKPVACIMIPYQLNEAKDKIGDIFKYHPSLSFALGFTEWGMGTIQITCSLYTTLLEFCGKRIKMGKHPAFNLISWYIRELKSRCIQNYLVPGGFNIDAQRPFNRVNVLESALLYEYPLDLVTTCDTLYFYPDWLKGGLLK